MCGATYVNLPELIVQPTTDTRWSQREGEREREGGKKREARRERAVSKAK